VDGVDVTPNPSPSLFGQDLEAFVGQLSGETSYVTPSTIVRMALAADALASMGKTPILAE
jgi:hypothetical protein